MGEIMSLDNDEVTTTIDSNTELAKRRTYDASERTLMAWIRTTLSMITFGFGVDKITEAILRTQLKTSQNLIIDVRIFGLSLVVLGVFGLVIALIEHSREIKKIKQPGYQYRTYFPFTLVIGWAIAVVGLFALVTILFRNIS
jgi:uncharacterized membrane protein YidH (DUF202 family)